MLTDTVDKEKLTAELTGLDTIKSLWRELEQLYESVDGLQTAISAVADEQKEKFDSIFNSLANKDRQESPAQVDTQPKQLQEQRSVIETKDLASGDHDSHVDPKLKHMGPVKEYLTKLISQNGSLRATLDAVTREAETKAVHNDEGDKTMLGKLKALQADNDSLSLEYEALKQLLNDTGKKADGRFGMEINNLRAKLDKETARANHLDAMIMTLRRADRDQEAKYEKSITELKMAEDAYKKQSTEYAKVFAVSGTIITFAYTSNLMHMQERTDGIVGL